jgi:hypothetical protein
MGLRSSKQIDPHLEWAQHTALFILLEKWIPEFITVYGDIGEKHHCSYAEFISGLIEYVRSIKHYEFPNNLCMETLIWMTDDILYGVYPKTILKKGMTMGASGKHDVYTYLSGVRLKTMP